MKTTNPIISFILSIFFLKDYNLSKEKLQKFKKRLPYFLGIWILFIMGFMFGLPNVLGDIPENIGLQITFLFFLAFSIYHWFLMVYISKFTPKHLAYFILLLPISVVLIWNLVLWNKPTYFGAMDGFANLMTAQMQILMIAILPTFLFALRMVKFKNRFKGIYLLLIVLYSAIMGLEQCIGKEGYLSDGTGNVFVIFIVLLLVIAFLLLKPTNYLKV